MGREGNLHARTTPQGVDGRAACRSAEGSCILGAMTDMAEADRAAELFSRGFT